MKGETEDKIAIIGAISMVLGYLAFWGTILYLAWKLVHWVVA